MFAVLKGPVVLLLGACAAQVCALRLAEPAQPGMDPSDRYGSVSDLLLSPTGVQWRRPIGDFPQLPLVPDTGQGSLHTVVPSVHDGLPVVSLVLPYADLFDPERGIYTVGNAILHDQDQVALKYMREPRWWKYPGNYLFRGKEWEREAHIEVLDSTGAVRCNERVGVRINGNSTRGFPQRALRITFKEKHAMRFFGDAPRTYDELVLRASGNDQDRTMFRDALQHRLCEGLPFAVSRAEQSVVYINGAYWGIHNIRERVEDDELALRYGLKKKNIVILADRALLYRGEDSTEAQRFKVMLRRLERMDPTAQALVDSLEAHFDMEGFLTYMAAQIVFCNTDWPDQNVKYWRYTGAPDSTNARTDGRWRFIMGDSDLGFGYAELPPARYPDMFVHLHGKLGPVARLFKLCMRSPTLEARFGTVLRKLLDGPLSEGRMVEAVKHMAGHIDAEMYRQVRRWRRPADHAAWEGHVNWMVTFAHNRPATLWKQWQARKKDRSGS